MCMEENERKYENISRDNNLLNFANDTAYKIR